MALNEIEFSNKKTASLKNTLLSEEQLFGYEVAKQVEKQNDEKKPELKSFVPAREEDDVATISAGGHFGQYYDIYGTHATNDKDLILKYRAAAEQPEVDMAIQDIVDEAIASLEHGDPAYIVLDDLRYDKPVKEKITQEFQNVLRLLKFSENGADIFRNWYVDGRLYYHIVVDTKKPKEGIQDLRMIDPIKMRRVREIKTETDRYTNAKLTEVEKEYYIFDDTVNFNQSTGAMSGLGGLSVNADSEKNQALKVAPEAIVRVTSGLMDTSRKKTLSYLHKALKVVNQLRMTEDALIIYRLARAPERRIFYVDVGNLPKSKAEEYVNKIMAKYRNKIVYDANTGSIKDQRHHMSMMEDFWLPRREGNRGTEIDTLQGGENLGQIDDVVYFQKRLYKALNIPQTRLEPEESFTTGRATEINRDEVKFQKFINRLRKKFSKLFLDILKTQLQLKGIVSETDWDDIVQDIKIDYVQDNHFYELKEYEILRDRLDILRDVEEYVGKYFSRNWVRRNILQFDDDQIKKISTEIEDEKKSGEIKEEEDGRW
jgi:hypothetical protein